MFVPVDIFRSWSKGSRRCAIIMGVEVASVEIWISTQTLANTSRNNLNLKLFVASQVYSMLCFAITPHGSLYVSSISVQSHREVPKPCPHSSAMFRNTYPCHSWQRDTWSERLALARAFRSRSVTATENVFHCVGLNRKEGRPRLQLLDVNGKLGVNQCSG